MSHCHTQEVVDVFESMGKIEGSQTRVYSSLIHFHYFLFIYYPMTSTLTKHVARSSKSEQLDGNTTVASRLVLDTLHSSAHICEHFKLCNVPSK